MDQFFLFMKLKKHSWIVFILAIIAGFILSQNFSFSPERKTSVDKHPAKEATIAPLKDQKISEQKQSPSTKGKSSEATDIKALTEESRVIGYLKDHQQLPDYYILKAEARAKGWIPSKGNLCEVIPGKAIGGDRFGNREGRLPKQKERQYYEADINYNCGRRGADRLIFSNDGLIYITKDHYNTFIKQ